MLKRKYERLEERSDGEHRLLELLRSACATDALRIVECLRAGDDVQSIIDFAHDLTLGGSALGGTILPDQSDEERDPVLPSGDTLSKVSAGARTTDARVSATARAEQVEAVPPAQTGDAKAAIFLHFTVRIRSV